MQEAKLKEIYNYAKIMRPKAEEKLKKLRQEKK